MMSKWFLRRRSASHGKPVRCQLTVESLGGRSLPSVLVHAALAPIEAPHTDLAFKATVLTNTSSPEAPIAMSQPTASPAGITPIPKPIGSVKTPGSNSATPGSNAPPVKTPGSNSATPGSNAPPVKTPGSNAPPANIEASNS